MVLLLSRKELLAKKYSDVIENWLSFVMSDFTMTEEEAKDWIILQLDDIDKRI